MFDYKKMKKKCHIFIISFLFCLKKTHKWCAEIQIKKWYCMPSFLLIIYLKPPIFWYSFFKKCIYSLLHSFVVPFMLEPLMSTKLSLLEQGPQGFQLLKFWISTTLNMLSLREEIESEVESSLQTLMASK
jgi:hypothetical protein